ncbi:oxidase/peroxidase [Holotrichia oblita]|uniref:Oxidase/peroxidase n=1 Tax=Holotrichia oblita TaxID=644536 RepID=A0ACB9SRK1_HOLOL|nr:oxidase/peroxidase [Holotrichia oblita]
MCLKIVLILTLFVCAVKLQNTTVVVQPPAAPPPTPDSRTPRIDNRTQTPWAGYYQQDQRDHLARWLLSGWNAATNTTTIRSTEAELPGYDGWYNNLDKPDMGAIDGHLLRRWPAAYEDGTYAPSGTNRPNPIELSDSLLAGPIGSKSRTGKSALLVFFGQQVVEEILDAQRPACPPEYFNIPIPKGHRYRDTHSEMPLLRTRYDQRTGYSPNNPRQQLNEITPYIDGGLFYGTTKQWADRLRTYSNGTVDPDGKLAYSHDGLFPEYNTERLPLANPPPPFHHHKWIEEHETAKVSRFFKLGNPRGNENTFLLTFGILWFRWHNYLATAIRRDHSDWSSDKVFNEARKWVIATYQHIVVDEWIPTWLNQDSLAPYERYDPSINPQIDQFFQAAAFRFGHTLVVPGVYLRDYSRNGCSTTIKNWMRPAVRTCNAFWRPQDALKTVYDNATKELVDIDRVLMGMAVQLCEEEDHKIVEDLRGNVFGPLEFPRRDLMAVNIQRGRDHGLPDFNTAREAYGLPRITSFDHFNAHEDVRKNMSKLYEGDVNRIDPWVGGILETVDGPGELFKTVIKDQFTRIRDGDRFWYENRKNKLFNEEEIARIKQLKLYDVIMAVTKMDFDDIQEEVFRVPTAPNQVQRCTLQSSPCKFPNRPNTCYHLPQLNAQILQEDCKQGTTYDYFVKSPVPYILTFASIGAFIIGVVGLIYTLILLKEQRKKDKELKVSKRLQQSVGKGMEVLHLASEWRGTKTPSRGILLKCDKDKMQLQILSRKGCLLRALDLHTKNRSLDIFTTRDKNYIIIKTQNDHDLVLNFESEFLQAAFNSTLKLFLDEFQTPYTESQISKLVPNEIETYDKRKAKLDMFFRVVFAQAFKISYSKEEMLTVDRDFKEVAQFEITMYEFADILGMHPDKEFIQRMFLLIDKDKNGFISFREFTDLLVIFAKGTELEKGKLLFDMYDIDAIGYLTKEDFIAMIRSFLDTVGGTVDNEELEKAILDMMRSAGLQNKDKLDFQDFLALVGDDIKKLNKATLGFKGMENENKYLDTARQTIEDLYWDKDEINQRFQGNVNNYSKQIDDNQEKAVKKVVVTEISCITTALHYIENNAVYLFWKSLFTLVVIAIFVERAYHYSVEAEHGGLRRIAGYGVTVTRGAASAMMFTYSLLLVTMCRNLWCFLRDTAFSRYLPLDAMVEFHKYIAYTALVATRPWTNHIRKIYDEASPQARPQLYLDGPYGESHQDWYQFDVSILVGAAQIGVFSCGPPPMTNSVETACFKINQTSATGPLFVHHSKNF